MLLALVVVLGWTQEAAALIELETKHDYTFRVGQFTIGFSDGHAWRNLDAEWDWSYVHIGPFGKRAVPFTATQGLVGFCTIVVGLAALLTTFTFLWKHSARNGNNTRIIRPSSP
jgi:hypothetical protein